MSLAQEVADLALRAATEIKAIRTLVNGNAADLSALNTTAKGNLVAALNELKASISAINGGAAINDASSSSTTQTYSITKILDVVNTAINNLTTGAPAAMNTLDELAAAIGDDSNFAATITTALANRLRVDIAQGLTAAQKLQGRQNLDAVSTTDVGDTTTDFVAIFEAGLN